MFSREYKSESDFSIMLAEELLREELKKLYGDEIKIFRRNIKATHINKNVPSDRLHRTVKITAIIGPFEKTYERSYEGDNRRNLRKVTATCGLASTTGSAIVWEPLYLKLELVDPNGNESGKLSFSYGDESRDIYVSDSGFINQHKKNPCADMCDSQIPANYPGLHQLA